MVREVLNSPPRVNDLTSDTLNLIVGIWEMIDMLRWETKWSLVAEFVFPDSFLEL